MTEAAKQVCVGIVTGPGIIACFTGRVIEIRQHPPIRNAVAVAIEVGDQLGDEVTVFWNAPRNNGLRRLYRLLRGAQP